MEREWNALGRVSTSMTASGTFIGGSFFSNTAVTVARLLAEYIIRPTSAPVAGDQVNVTVGVGLFSTDAVTLGATAVPDPFDEAEFPWMYYASHNFLFASTDPDSASAGASVRRSIDIRSMRKVRPGHSLAWVIQYVDISGAPPMTFAIGKSRILLLGV